MNLRFKQFTEQSRHFKETICNHYTNAPEVNEEIIPAWTALRLHIDYLWQEMRGKVKFEWSEQDPYKNAQEMMDDIQANKRLKVYTGYNNHPLIRDGRWDEETNLRFRGIHDYWGHYVKGHPFSYKGEIDTYFSHMRVARTPTMLPALFCEILGQASCTELNGSFPPQKIVDFREIINLETLELV